ncbi:MAG: hypothetical protein ACKE5M_03520 [Methylophilaceae bacterium]
MSPFEKTELTLILILSICTCLLSFMLPSQVAIGNLILAASALLLLQSLLRDLFLIARMKRSSKQYKELRCMCLESTIGMTGIIIGAGVVGIGIDQLVAINRYTWVVLIVFIMVMSFLIKDFVIQSSPWCISQDKDHLNILVKWN